MPPRVGIKNQDGAKLQPEGRRCSICGAFLSIYNPNKECSSHSAPMDARGDPGASRLGGGNWTSAANSDGHR